MRWTFHFKKSLPRQLFVEQIYSLFSFTGFVDDGNLSEHFLCTFSTVSPVSNLFLILVIVSCLGGSVKLYPKLSLYFIYYILELSVTFLCKFLLLNAWSDVSHYFKLVKPESKRKTGQSLANKLCI